MFESLDLLLPQLSCIVTRVVSKMYSVLGMVVHAFEPITQEEVEAELANLCEFGASLVCIVVLGR